VNIQITEAKDRKSPVEIRFGTRAGLIELQLAFERFLADASELRAAFAKCNGAYPVKPLKSVSYFDEVIAFGNDLMSDLEARPDMIREQYEGDR
jgi:hypothetical protein